MSSLWDDSSHPPAQRGFGIWGTPPDPRQRDSAPLDSPPGSRRLARRSLRDRGRAPLVRALLTLSVAVTLLAATAGAKAAAGQGLVRDPLATRLPSAQARCDASGAGAGAAGSRQALHHAGLVIVFPEGRTESFCIEFSEDEISGAELLQRSGLSVVFSSFGGLGAGVCRIDDTGCGDPGDCFCHCRGADCAYWAYFGLEGGEWQFQNIGPSQRHLRDGDADGWVWGSGRTLPGQLGANGSCPAAMASPTPTVRPTYERSRVDAGEKPTPGPEDGRAAAGAGASPTGLPTMSGWSAVAALQTVQATPQHEVRRVGAEDESPRASEHKTTTAEGLPAGLIAFGAVAALLIASIGGLALRRRLRG